MSWDIGSSTSIGVGVGTRGNVAGKDGGKGPGLLSTSPQERSDAPLPEEMEEDIDGERGPGLLSTAPHEKRAALRPSIPKVTCGGAKAILMASG